MLNLHKTKEPRRSVVSALDSHRRPGFDSLTSQVSLSDLHSPFCRKVTVQVCRPLEAVGPMCRESNTLCELNISLNKNQISLQRIINPQKLPRYSEASQWVIIRNWLFRVIPRCRWILSFFDHYLSSILPHTF